MNLVIPGIAGRSWQQVRWQSVSIAAGLALMAAAALALTGGSAPKMPAVTGVNNVASVPSIARAPIVRAGSVFYLVDDREQAGKVREYEQLAEWVRFGMNAAKPDRSFSIFTGPGLDEEQALVQTLSELRDQDLNFEVVDLRGRR